MPEHIIKLIYSGQPLERIQRQLTDTSPEAIRSAWIAWRLAQTWEAGQ